MVKKRIFREINIWLIMLIAEIVTKVKWNEIIYIQIIITGIILSIEGYIRGKIKYRSIPIKSVEAKFVKSYKTTETSDYDDRCIDITVSRFEYYLNNKKYKYNIKGEYDSNIFLYYRKGKKDITCNQDNLNQYPYWEELRRVLLICPGSAIILTLILNFIFKIPIDF